MKVKSNLCVSLGKVSPLNILCDGPQFRGTDRGVIGRMRKQDGPARSQPIVEFDLPMRSFRLKVWHNVSQVKSHGFFFFLLEFLSEKKERK